MDVCRNHAILYVAQILVTDIRSNELVAHRAVSDLKIACPTASESTDGTPDAPARCAT